MNPEMEYVLIRREEDFDAEGVLVVARDRLEALQKPLGSFEEIGSISGPSASKTHVAGKLKPSIFIRQRLGRSFLLAHVPP